MAGFLRAVQGSLAWTDDSFSNFWRAGTSGIITYPKKNHPAMVSQPAEAKVKSQWPETTTVKQGKQGASVAHLV